MTQVWHKAKKMISICKIYCTFAAVLATGNTYYCATIGFFDGVHRGHQYVLSELSRVAKDEALKSLAVTFVQHPKTILTTDPVQLLTLPDERKVLLRQHCDEVLMLDFEAYRHYTARQFMEYLHSIGVRHLLLGYDNRFGSDKLTDIKQYEKIASEVGITLGRLGEETLKDTHISSTVIRQSLSQGEIEKANSLLGYSYTLRGEVVEGKHIGRRIGFPTANLLIPSEKLLPKQGVYSAVVTTEDGIKNKAILNIGTNPTVGSKQISIEAHILDFNGDLYGQILSIELHHYIREERMFDSLEQLRLQIKTDIQLC